jgi:hypothetical protein
MLKKKPKLNQEFGEFPFLILKHLFVLAAPFLGVCSYQLADRFSGSQIILLTAPSHPLNGIVVVCGFRP